MPVAVDSGTLRLNISDALTSFSGRRFPLMPDHAKLMHLFLVRAEDLHAFAHLHPAPSTDAWTLASSWPPLPSGTYRAFGDVVDETGLERTVVGLFSVPEGAARATKPSDPDDSWFVGEPSRDKTKRLADESTMTLEIVPNGLITSGREETLRIFVRDPNGKPAVLEPYLGMAEHVVVVRVDGSVFVHLHPMGTVTVAAQQAFAARDRGDTTLDGRLRIAADHSAMRDTVSATSANAAESALVEFPYAFPRSGSYRLFV